MIIPRNKYTWDYMLKLFCTIRFLVILDRYIFEESLLVLTLIINILNNNYSRIISHINRGIGISIHTLYKNYLQNGNKISLIKQTRSK